MSNQDQAKPDPGSNVKKPSPEARPARTTQKGMAVAQPPPRPPRKP